MKTSSLLTLGAAALTLCASAAVAQQPAPGAVQSLSVATLAPVGSTWMRVFEQWSRELRRVTNQRLQLRMYPNGLQGDEAEVVRKMRSRRIDGAALTGVGLAQIHRPVLAFQIPGMFRSYAELDRARDALRPELDQSFQAAGFTLVGWGDVGQDRIFARRAVATPADFAGTRPFLWRDDPTQEPFFQEVGARGVPLQVPEVLTSLELHQIDSVVASPLGVAALQWAGHLTHMTNLEVEVEIGALVFSRQAIEALAPDLQQALRTTAQQYTTLLVRNVRRDDEATLAPMRERGITTVNLTDAQRAQWQTVFTGTRARLVGQLCDSAWLERVSRAAQAR